MVLLHYIFGCVYVFFAVYILNLLLVPTSHSLRYVRKYYNLLHSPTKQMRSAYCLRGRFYGTVYSLRIYPISSAEEHQIRSAFSANT
jgi:hypothetical protein